MEFDQVRGGEQQAGVAAVQLVGAGGRICRIRVSHLGGSCAEPGRRVCGVPAIQSPDPGELGAVASAAECASRVADSPRQALLGYGGTQFWTNPPTTRVE